MDGQAGDGNIAATEEWHHLVLRHEAGGNLHGFVDGQLAFTRGAGMGNVGAIELLIGSSDKNGFEPYPGLIDDFIIYNRTLEDDEIQQLAAGAKPVGGQAVELTGKLATCWAILKR